MPSGMPLPGSLISKTSVSLKRCGNTPCPRSKRRPLKIDDDTASFVATGNRLLKLDFGIANVFRGDMAKYIGSHHAHGFPANTLSPNGQAVLPKMILSSSSSMM